MGVEREREGGGRGDRDRQTEGGRGRERQTETDRQREGERERQRPTDDPYVHKIFIQNYVRWTWFCNPPLILCPEFEHGIRQSSTTAWQ